MTVLDILAMCQARGVHLVAEGARIILKGPQAGRDEMRPLVAAHKLELLAALRSPATTTRRPLPPDGPCQVWAYNWRGAPVNLFGLRGDADGRPPVFVWPMGGSDAPN
jgi:hypothetical protein